MTNENFNASLTRQDARFVRLVLAASFYYTHQATYVCM